MINPEKFRKPSVSIFGGSTTYFSNGQYFTKGQFAYYLKKLDEEFRITWYCRQQNTISLCGEIPRGVDYRELKLKNMCQLVTTDVIMFFIPQSYRFLPLIIIMRLLGKRVIMYSGTDFELEYKQEIYWFRKFLRKLAQRTSILVSHVVFVRGRRAQNFSKQINENTILSLPIIRPPSVEWRFPNNSKIQILYVGKLQPSKGIYELCSCVRELVKTGHAIHLNVVGSGVSEANLKSEFGDDNHSGVTFHGWVDDRYALERLFLSSNLAVFPSQEFGPEGVPRVIQEALMIGIPTLITPHPVFIANGLDKVVYRVANGFDKVSLKNEIVTFISSKTCTNINKQKISSGDASTQHSDVIKRSLQQC